MAWSRLANTIIWIICENIKVADFSLVNFMRHIIYIYQFADLSLQML